MNGISLKKPISLSELMRGTELEFSSTQDYEDCEFDEAETFWSIDDNPDKYKSPCDCETSFDDWRRKMTKISEGVYKEVCTVPADDAKTINLNCQRITYHRNMYFENDDHPFDSTYLNGKTDVICLPLNLKKVYLEGILEALETMKEGEKSLFLIGYMKMFKEQGCLPRVPPKADVLCELEVLKVEEIGDQEIIKNLENGENTMYADIKDSLEQIFIKAIDNFSQKKFHSAIKGYVRIYQAANFSKTANEEEEEKRQDTLKRVHSNLAVCNNKIGEYKETLKHIKCLEHIGSIDDNPKVLYNKGIALMKLGEFNDAAGPITKALKLEPLNQEIIKAVEELDQRKKKYEENRRAFAARAFK